MTGVESKEWDGEFWLPTEPDRRIRGRLTFDPHDGTTLSVEEYLTEPSLSEGARTQQYRQILGEVFRDGDVSLGDAFTRRVSSFPQHGQQHVETVFANRLVVGGLESDPDLERFWLSSSNVLDFLDPNGTALTLRNSGLSSREVLMNDCSVTELFETPIGMLSLERSQSSSNVTHRIVLEVGGTIGLRCTVPTPASIAEEMARRAKLFVDFATHQPGSIEAQAGVAPDGSLVTFLGVRGEVAVGRSRRWMSVDDFGERLGTAFGEWLGFCDESEVAFHALAELVVGVGTLPDRFLAAARFVEYYGASRDLARVAVPDEDLEMREQIFESLGDEQVDWLEARLPSGDAVSFAARLRAIVDEFGSAIEPVVGADLEDFVRAVRDTRNQLTHLASKKHAIVGGTGDLYFLFERVWFIGKACVLRELGFENDQIRELLQRDGWFDVVAESPLRGVNEH